MKLVSKTPIDGVVHLTFVSVDSQGGAHRNVSAEDAEYYVAGRVYEIFATHP